MITSWVGPNVTPRRLRLREAIDKMAAAIATGECQPPSAVELDALAQLCEEQFLPCEAARVRRWRPSCPIRP